MNKQEFLKQQYISLRDEIKETKERIFKIMGFGLVAVPGSYFLAHKHGIETVMVSLPIFIIIVALIYLGENNALMRCGRYIKYYIEPEIKVSVGWEKWLETKSEYDTRNVDKYLSYAFYLLFFVYFTGSVSLTARHTFMNHGILCTSVILGVYTAVGVWFVIYLFKNIKVSTTTKRDKTELGNDFM